MLTDVWTKFRLFQKPANFDARLAECERALAVVKSQVGVLDIRSVEQDVVQSQLEQCMVGNCATLAGGLMNRCADLTLSSCCLCLTEVVQDAE